MPDTTFLNWPRDNIPPSYQKINWQDRLERTERDYGVPDKPYMPGYKFTDAERTDEYYQRDGAPF